MLKVTKSQLRRIIAERFTPDDFKDVYNTARMAHVGQTRRDGSEYFSHPSEVRNIARRFYPRDNVVQMAALLHDSLEDAPGSTVSSVEEMEEFIRGSIQDPSSADEVIRVVRSLTHEKGGNYTDYVVGLLGDIPTLRVKLADMVHNLSDNPKPKQKIKYRSALDAIGDRTGGRAPAGISSQHWEELLSLTEGTKMKITKSQLRRIIRESILLEQPGSQADEIIAWAKTPGNRVDVDGKVAYAGVKPLMGLDITQDAAADYAKKGPAFEKMIRSLPDGSRITLKKYGFRPSGGGSWKSHKTMYIGGTKPKAQPKLNTRRMQDILDITAGVQPDEIKSVNPYTGTDSPFKGQTWRVETNGGNVYLFPSGRNNRAEFAEKTDMYGRPSATWQMTSINLR